MTVNVVTDGDTDRILSLRMSSQVPLPREISLCGPRDAERHFAWMGFYEAMGLESHPLVRLLAKRRLDIAMASAVSRASHLDRVAHYSAWLGRETVSIVDLTSPTSDDDADHGSDEG